MKLPTAPPRSPAVAGAIALAALLMLVPANLLPVISLDSSGSVETDTIYSGIVSLCEQGAWGVGLIVFVASILVPFVKLAGLGLLLLAARRGAKGNEHAYVHLHACLDFIGRWSMLDVFLVGFMSGLVRFGQLATVEPRIGILAFAIAAILTIIATQAFDPRIFWRDAGARARISSP